MNPVTGPGPFVAQPPPVASVAMLETEILVVGAGPAGSAAAITLANAGRDVTLVDKATFPRDKCCGDGLTSGALRMLERLGFDPASVPSWQTIDAAWVRSPSGREVRFPMPTDGIYAAVAPRTELDDALVAARPGERRQGPRRPCVSGTW